MSPPRYFYCFNLSLFLSLSPQETSQEPHESRRSKACDDSVLYLQVISRSPNPNDFMHGKILVELKSRARLRIDCCVSARCISTLSREVNLVTCTFYSVWRALQQLAQILAFSHRSYSSMTFSQLRRSSFAGLLAPFQRAPAAAARPARVLRRLLGRAPTRGAQRPGGQALPPQL